MYKWPPQPVKPKAYITNHGRGLIRDDADSLTVQLHRNRRRDKQIRPLEDLRERPCPPLFDDIKKYHGRPRVLRQSLLRRSRSLFAACHVNTFPFERRSKPRNARPPPPSSRICRARQLYDKKKNVEDEKGRQPPIPGQHHAHPGAKCRAQTGRTNGTKMGGKRSEVNAKRI